ncbi:MAG TPA: ATP-binding protein [Candidatus Krumholzibacteria bacterium]|nr:ATP-binding protein [Candidatus Krumholzibacteria bacterium]
MVHSNAGAKDPRRALDRFLLLRTIVACLVVGAGVTIVALTETSFDAKPLYLLLAVSAVIGAIGLTLTRLGVPVRRISWGVVVADIGFAAGIVYYSGGVSGQFTTVFCLTIAAAAFLLEMPGGLASSVLSSLCFIAFQLLEAWGVMSPPGKGQLPQPHVGGLIDAYMHASMFLLVGTVGGYLADRIKLKGRALQHAESALEQLRIDTNYILENMSSGVLVVDTDGRVLTMNAAAEEILELRKDDVLSHHVDGGLALRAPDLAYELVQSLASERPRRRQEISGHSRAGAYRPMGISISPLTDGAQRRRGVIAVFQDLTEVHEMRERVRKADRLAAVGELSAGIAHELRNPLASISGSIEMLYHELALDGENKRLMELIMRESDRLDRIISDFLEFARLRTPRRVPSKLARCIEDVVTLVKQNTEKIEGVTIRTVFEPSLPDAWIDDEQMRQVFMSLAVNACEAMENGGTLEITAERAGEQRVRVAFKDSGPGIDPEGLERMFEPFFTTKDGGTGLGLAMANKIVTAHGGSIEFRNAERGAIFTIVLPVGSPAREKTEAAESVLAASD